ncbi:DEAD/DEAH box helicase [Actinophytocola sediminis]
MVPRLQITGRSLHEFVADLAVELSVDTGLRPAGVRVECRVVSVRGGEEAEPAFLNSFIANDLARIETAVRVDDRGAALRDYLSDAEDISIDDRVDVRTAPAATVSGVAPERTPAGRWPTATARPLVVSQQFAVNQIMSELAPGEGVFAVNGPPGTGKTTTLRDVLAAIVVERAGRLAALRDPTDAFTSVLERVQLAPKYTATVRAVRPELTGFEIVVATASNDAAENVTAEVPGIAAVGGAEADALAVDYFTALASHVLGGEAWGMVAAVLGNMKNRAAFVRRFWYGDTVPGKKDTEPVVGMMQILREVRENPDGVPDWTAAVTAFRAAEKEVRRLAAERQRVADRIDEFARVQAAVPGIKAAVRDAAASCEEIRDLVATLTEALERASNAFQDADDELERHVEHKPGFWIVLATFFRAGRRWNTDYERLAGLRAETKKVRDELTAALSWRKSEQAAALLVRQRCENKLRDAEHAMAAARVDIDAACARWPGTVPFGEHREDDEKLQLSAPWADEEFTAARNQVFLASLRLHKAFLLNAERMIRGNLAVIIASLRTRLQIGKETLLAAWQALFLVVPMISTTFASLPRLFGGLGRESFGWLFIDEAGQATPQQAVGGLWRSRRAVIVGDPRQLEPIVTLPSTAQDAIRDYHRVAEEWTPDGTSVQRVADRLARHGTYLAEPDGETTVWVGAPLRVHRRCDHPIFTVANTIAYGGDLMVYGTADRDAFPGENLWLDVPSGQSRGNWVPAEGQALATVLDELAMHGVQKEQIRVISPFRDVVQGSKETARQAFGRAFVNKNVGTVHTVQGQEADVIILVLGSAPGNERARAWAAEKPNLLNVAVSRAKRRLYVIGDHRRWRVQPYFSVLATIIEHRSAPLPEPH